MEHERRKKEVIRSEEVKELPSLKGRTDRDEALRAGLRRSKKFATGLFIFMVAVYIASKSLERTYPWLAPVIAFTEAAMVGALADWFAVVALFRYPLNIPIPHTAIIQRNKDKFGEALANFIKTNFLVREALEAKLNALDMIGWVSEILSNREKATKIANKLVDSIVLVADKWDDKELSHLTVQLITDNIKAIKVLPLLGKALDILVQQKRHQALLDEAVVITSRMLSKNRDGLRDRIRDEYPWWVPEFIDEKIFQKIMGRVEETLAGIQENDNHEVRQKFDEAVHRFIQKLMHSEEFDKGLQKLREQILSDPAARERFEVFWQELKGRLLEDLRAPDSPVRLQIEKVIVAMGTELAENEKIRESINHWIRSSLINVTEQYSDAIISIVSDTVKRWDPEKTSQRIELYVGKDLQWIRVNGTLVGGLVGLLIYLISKFF
jgi:uncharacterized membrane-anchored protein YjiN (DUF445 family)